MKITELFSGYMDQWNKRSYTKENGREFAGRYISDLYRDHKKEMKQINASDIEGFVNDVDSEQLLRPEFEYFMNALMNRHVHNRFYEDVSQRFIRENGEIDLKKVSEEYLAKHPLNKR